MGFHLHIQRKHRLMVAIGISFVFFVAELTTAFKTKSLALIADAFHYMNDFIGFVVALVAVLISERSKSPMALSFGWQRAQLLGAFFNGVFLMGLGISITLQTIERFITLQRIEEPVLVLIMGCVGFALNVVSALFLHEHDHGSGGGHGHARAENDSVIGLEPTGSGRLENHAEHRHLQTQWKAPGRDLNMVGAMLHVVLDAVNNIGVIVVAVIIWQLTSEKRFYADPAIGLGIALMILLSSYPLVKNSGAILLESAPLGVDLEDVKHDLERIPGVVSVHELHIWRLNQAKALASAHIVVSDTAVSSFMGLARIISECLHDYGVHSATLQPEVASSAQTSQLTLVSTVPEETAVASIREGERRGGGGARGPSGASSIIRRRIVEAGTCQITCGSHCEKLMCCT